MNLELGISDKVFVFIDIVVLMVLGEVSFLSVFVLAAKICSEGVEATFFAAFMFFFNVGGVMSEFLGVGLIKLFGVIVDNFDNFFLLLFICFVIGLFSFVVINFIDEVKDDDADDVELV